MPLQKSSSESAFRKNLSTEYKNLRSKGKSKDKARKQALAIAFETRRRAKKESK